MNYNNYICTHLNIMFALILDLIINIADTMNMPSNQVYGLSCGIVFEMFAFGFLLKSLTMQVLTRFTFACVAWVLILIALIATLTHTIYMFKPIIIVVCTILGISTLIYSSVSCYDILINYKLTQYNIWDNQCGNSLISLCIFAACHMLFNIICFALLLYKARNHTYVQIQAYTLND